MGKLINGQWKNDDVRETGLKSENGEFKRQDSTFRDSISLDSSFKPEAERYHLYLSYACPWAHRTLLMRNFKGLHQCISTSFVSPLMLDKGWSFSQDTDSIPDDPIKNRYYLYEVYTETDPQFSGKVTVPILYDKKTNQIVNNESSEIIRILNNSFQEWAENKTDYYPKDLQNEIDTWNEEIYDKINNGVYKCGFARSQKAYEQSFDELFSCLDKVDLHLQKNKYLCGDKLTEADMRLFPTLFRFDAVYYTHFKCNGRLVADYKGLNRFAQEFYNLPGVKETTNMNHVKAHYYYSHSEINPSRIIAKGPLDNFD